MNARPGNLAGKPQVTPEILREFLDYNHETGCLTWKQRDVKWFASPAACQTWNARFAGKPAFSTHAGRGYLSGEVFTVRFKAHRVAWAIYHGKWPSNEIDHINHDTSDNRIDNLRDVPRSENLKNRPAQKNNQSGFVGVRWNRHIARWTAFIGVSNDTIYLGSFSTAQDAINARVMAEKQFGFHPNGGCLAHIRD